jgi:hypothetical protein
MAPSFVISALDKYKWSASGPGHFFPREISPSYTGCLRQYVTSRKIAGLIPD